jgi:hypothetical protein
LIFSLLSFFFLCIVNDKKDFEAFNCVNSICGTSLIVFASLVGCGEARTASIEAVGFNEHVGQQHDNTKFSTSFQRNTTSLIDAVRASPHPTMAFWFQ